MAGAQLGVVALLGLSMTFLQFAIGALNDVHDAPADAATDRVPPKPIPAGLVSADVGRLVVVASASIGLGLAALFGSALLVLAGVVLVIGFGYDLVAKGTAWSWLPFAIGIPILPVYGWFGATGVVADWTVGLVPAAALVGAALALANALADVERDMASGITTIVTKLGVQWSRRALVGAWAGAVAIALGWLVADGASAMRLAAFVPAVSVVLGGVVLAWSGGPGRREWGWRVQAVGAGLTAVAWLTVVASATGG